MIKSVSVATYTAPEPTTVPSVRIKKLLEKMISEAFPMVSMVIRLKYFSIV